MLRPKSSSFTSVVLILSVFMVFWSQTQQAGAAETISINFDATSVGELPAGFSTAVTGGGGKAEWKIVNDDSAPSGGKVLAQTSTDKTSYRFPLFIYEGLTVTNGMVSIRFKPISGTVDQAAGLVARYQDKDNYYIVRANALEGNVRLYKVQQGERKQFAGASAKVPVKEWQTLALEVQGSRFRVYLNGGPLFEADDATFKDAGKIGLWTKADSVTYFDDMTVKTSEAH